VVKPSAATARQPRFHGSPISSEPSCHNTDHTKLDTMNQTSSNQITLVTRQPHVGVSWATAILALALTGTAAAAITAGDPNPGGIGYAFHADLGPSETAVQKHHVGAWSWEDQGLFGEGEDPVGWTHTSNWYAITLQADSVLTLTIGRDATVPLPDGGFRPVDHMFPSFTLWSGWDNDAVPDAVALALGYTEAELPIQDHHTYNNDGLVEWAEDITYLDHYANSSMETISRSWSLPAGPYTLVIGSNAPSESNPPRQGYQATFVTTPVPEPSTSLLGLIGTCLILRRRR